MFDFDASKLLIVGVIALIFIPSKDLPRVLRQVGQFVAKARKMASEFQGQFMDAMKEADMADLRREAQKLAETARVDVGLDHMTDLKSHLTSTVEGRARPTSPRPDGFHPTSGGAAEHLEAPIDGAPVHETAVHDTTIHDTTIHETMDGAGLKDPNAELRLLTNTVPDVRPADRTDISKAPVHDDAAHPTPIVHSAL